MEGGREGGREGGFFFKFELRIISTLCKVY